MRVLKVLGTGVEGGAETFFTHMALALQRAGVETHAAIGPNPGRAAMLRGGGVETIELPFRKILDFKTRRELKREIKRFQPDVVLTYMNRASKMCPTGDFVRLARLGGYYKLKNYRNCDHLIAITQDLKDYLVREGWPEERVHFLPNFSAVEHALPIDRAELDTPEDATVLLSLGRLHHAKAIDILLKAMTIESRPYVWLAGDGPLRAELEAMARDLGVADRVRFLGWRTDRGALLAAADICVFPSRYEPFGSVTLEAWGTKTPLIAAASAGPAATVTPDEDALLVPIDDAEALAGAMTRMIDEPGLAERLVEAGWKRYQEDYTEEACVKRYVALFERLIAERKGIGA